MTCQRKERETMMSRSKSIRLTLAKTAPLHHLKPTRLALTAAVLFSQALPTTPIVWTWTWWLTRSWLPKDTHQSGRRRRDASKWHMSKPKSLSPSIRRTQTGRMRSTWYFVLVYRLLRHAFINGTGTGREEMWAKSLLHLLSQNSLISSTEIWNS